MADFIDLDKGCIDPIAQTVILAAIDYAVSTTRAVAMTQGIQASADAIRNIREAIFKFPKCDMGRQPSPPPSGTKYTQPIRTTRVSTGQSVATTAAQVQKPTRTLPALLGKARWDGPSRPNVEHGQLFDNPTAMARALGFTTKQAGTTVEAYTRAGFTLTKDASGVWGATKIPGKDIPSKWRIDQPEIRVSPAPKPEKETKAGAPTVPVYQMVDGKKVLVKWQDDQGRDVPKDRWPRGSLLAESVEEMIKQIPENSRDAVRTALNAMPEANREEFVRDMLAKRKK